MSYQTRRVRYFSVIRTKGLICEGTAIEDATKALAADSSYHKVAFLVVRS